VLKWAPELADGVRTAAHSLDHAYEIASDRKTKAEAPTLRLQALRATDPDLADAVIEERQQLEAAEDQARGRRQREREKRQGIYDALIHIDRFFFVIGDPDHQRYIKDVCTEHPKELPIDRVMISINNWRTAIDVLEKTLTE